MHEKEPSSPPQAPITIAIQQGAIADYRVGFFRLLQQHYGKHRLRLYSGQEDFHPTIRTVSTIAEDVHALRNHFFFNRRFLWQGKRFIERFQSDVLVLNFNLRILSHYPMLILRWLLRKPTLLWGHVTGQSPLARYLGFLQLFFAKAFICYTHTQQKQYEKLHPWLKTQTFVAPNSCMGSSDCTPLERPLHELRDIVYVGRLVEYKKVHLLVEGFLLAQTSHLIPRNTRLVLIGTGPLENSLRALVASANATESVYFTGHISEISRLRERYSTAFCSVCPGALGLSVIQSFAFGVPLLVASDEPHGPEVEICHNLQFGAFFDSNSPKALSYTLKQAWEERKVNLDKRREIIEYTRLHHSFESMAKGFSEAVQFCLPSS